MADVVLRGVLFSLLFILAMKGMQHVAESRFGFAISNTMITWLCFVSIAIAFFGKAFSSTKLTIVFFAMTVVAFSLGALVQAGKRDREN
jgi:hypothetical protein